MKPLSEQDDDDDDDLTLFDMSKRKGKGWFLVIICNLTSKTCWETRSIPSPNHL